MLLNVRKEGKRGNKPPNNTFLWGLVKVIWNAWLQWLRKDIVWKSNEIWKDLKLSFLWGIVHFLLSDKENHITWFPFFPPLPARSEIYSVTASILIFEVWIYFFVFFSSLLCIHFMYIFLQHFVSLIHSFFLRAISYK